MPDPTPGQSDAFPVPGANGTVEAVPAETVLAHILRVTYSTDRASWQTLLQYCHVPPLGMALEWESGIARVLGCAAYMVVPR